MSTKKPLQSIIGDSPNLKRLVTSVTLRIKNIIKELQRVTDFLDVIKEKI